MTRRQHFTIIVLIGLLTGFVSSPVQAGRDQSIQEVQGTFDRYVEAWRQGDLKTLTDIYATDAKLGVYWPDPTRPSLIEGWDEVREHLATIFALTGGLDLEFTDQRIQRYGNIAILTSNWKWLVPTQPALATGRATFVFQRRGSKWVIVHEHSSLVPSFKTK